MTGLNAVLSGVGGDELFGGYGTLRRAHHLWRLRSLPTVMRKPLVSAGAWLPAWRKLAYLRQRGSLPFYLVQRGLFTPSEAARLLDTNESEAWAALDELDPPGRSCRTVPPRGRKRFGLWSAPRHDTHPGPESGVHQDARARPRPVDPPPHAGMVDENRLRQGVRRPPLQPEMPAEEDAGKRILIRPHGSGTGAPQDPPGLTFFRNPPRIPLDGLA